jgi:predicted branched-subunit amino acid permease
MTDSLRRGLSAGAGLAAGSFALAISCGAFAVLHGVPPWLAVVMSLVTFSGSAQFAFVTALGGGGVGPGLGAASLINLRFVPMAAATAPALRGGLLRRSLEAQAVVDGSWAAAQRADGGFDRDLMLAATLVQWPSWVAGTAIGALFVPSVATLRALGLDAVFPAFFALLLLDLLTARPALRGVAAASACCAGLALLVVPVGVAMLAGCLPPLLALRRPR